MSPVDSLRTETKFKKTEIGEIPVDWELVKLREYCDVVGGSTPSTKRPEYWNGDIPWAVPTDITELKGNVIGDTEKKITEEGLANCAAKILPAGSILLTSRATIGECAINSRPMATNQGFANLVCRSDLYNLFLLYRLKYIKKELESLSSGSTFREISKRSIRELRIPFPPFSEQKKIAEILSTVDEAIEKKKEIIEKTKELKKGLMQELLTRGIGHTKFKKTEIGEIPVDWRVRKLNEIGRLRGGSGFPEKYQGYPDGKYLFIKVSDMNLPGNEIYIKKTANTIDISTKEELGCHIFLKDTIIFAKVGAALLLNRRRILTKESCIDNNMMGLEISKENDPRFYYYIMQTIDFADHLFPGALPSVNQTVLGNIKVVNPPLFEQSTISNILVCIDEQIDSQGTLLREIEMVKIGLTSVLLTGKIRVRH